MTGHPRRDAVAGLADVVADIFDEFGPGVVAVASGATARRWDVGGGAVTVQTGTAFWSVLVTDAAGRSLCEVGRADADGRKRFGGLLLVTKAAMVEWLITRAEKRTNKRG